MGDKVIDEAIKRRKTQKVLATTSWPITLNEQQSDALISEMLSLASHAPYHYPSHKYHAENSDLPSALPFRFYCLDAQKCRETSLFIDQHHIVAGKVKNMLDAADVLFLVTWLPEPSDEKPNTEEISFDGNLKNMEHIAAASAAIQNVLIGATARNIPNYWSSGGVLKKEPLRAHLSIPSTEVFLGAVFLFPENSKELECQIVEGVHRNKGKEPSSWSKYVK